MLLIIVALIAAITGVASFLLLTTRRISPRRYVGVSVEKVRCLVILGSGGHTSEMFFALSGLTWRHYAPHYVIANTDRGSEAAMRDFEARHHPGVTASFSVIPRAREVGQSYITSIFTTLWSFLFSALVVIRVRPTVILTNGPGTAVPICVVAFALRLVGYRCSLVYMESFTCVHHLSVSGLILYRIADLFTVQWPHLLKSYPRAINVAPDLTSLPPLLPRPTTTGERYALVTVGSTSFDALIEACDQKWFVECIREKFGICQLRMQIGNGVYVPRNPDIEHLRFKREGFAQDLAKASLVIGHAGAGTIMDCMRAQTPMIVVPNESLMNNHQTQLCDALVEARLVAAVGVNFMKEKIPEIRLGDLRCYPSITPTTFRDEMEENRIPEVKKMQ